MPTLFRFLFVLPVMATASGEDAPSAWNLHAQATGIAQGHEDIRSPYAGADSLNAEGEVRGTATATLFFGARLWRGAAVYVDPELAQGYGLSDTLGVAGFPNGEATKVGSSTPRLYLARAFLRQDLDLGGVDERIDDGPNQLADRRGQRRMTITAGTFAASDLFDDNAFSHDARTQFMNWSLMEAGAWDYPADARSYTFGLAVEVHDGAWRSAVGSFLEPTEANGKHLETRAWRSFGLVAELDHQHALGEQPGTVRALAFANRAPMGHYAETHDQPGVPDLGQTRRAVVEIRRRAEHGSAPDVVARSVRARFLERWAHRDVGLYRD